MTTLSTQDGIGSLVRSRNNEFSRVIHQLISELSDQMMSQNRFFREAEKGQLTREKISLYLYNLKFVLERAVPNLSACAEISGQMGLTSLRDYALEKIPEETGHEEWAKNDLKNFSEQEKSGLYLTEASSILIQYAADLAKNDPWGYFSYITFVETFSVMVSPKFLKQVEIGSGVLATELTAIVEHAIADQKHIQDNFKLIDAEASPKVVNLICAHLRQTAFHVDRFFTEICDAGRS